MTSKREEDDYKVKVKTCDEGCCLTVIIEHINKGPIKIEDLDHIFANVKQALLPDVEKSPGLH